MKNVYLILAAIIISMLPGIIIKAQNTFPPNGSAGIGTNSPDASSILEIKSTTKGILIPRMTRIQRDAIVSPATGLMIFQTSSTPGFYYFDGGAWKAVASAGVNKSLSNLSSPTAVNVDLVPAADGSSNLGSSNFEWKNAYLGGNVYLGGAIYMNFGRFIGHPSGQNTFIGQTSGASFAGGVYNTGVGDSTLASNTTGSLNTANGFGALGSNTSSDYNSGFGALALNANTSGYYNTATGALSLLKNTTGSYNTANGIWSLYYNTTGSSNTAFGSYALQYNTTSDYNTAIGSGALSSNATGYSNTASGYQALFGNLGGSGNTASGMYALYNNTTGNNNTAVGNSAASFNDANSYCSFFGYDANQSVATDFTNSMALGNGARITASNQVRIGNGSITSIGGYANWSNISDGRFKKNIKENVPGLAFINKLKPVTYNLDITGLRQFLGEDVSFEKNGRKSVASDEKTKLAIEKKEKQIQTGFVAQDVEKAAKELGYDFSGVDMPENENSPYALRYSEFVVPLVKAVQELSKQNDDLQKENDELKSRLDKIEAMIFSNSKQNSDISNQQKINLDQTAKLEQNQPNPIAQTAVIKYFIPEQSSKSMMRITSANGHEIKSIDLSAKGNGQITLQTSNLLSGTYFYSLVIDGQIVDTKRMVIAH